MAAAKTLQTRVNHGSKLLDEKVPGWAEKIDVKKLDISSNQECILGLLGYGNPYVAAKKALGLTSTYGREAVQNGFCATTDNEAEKLTKLWLGAIAQRAKTKQSTKKSPAKKKKLQSKKIKAAKK